MATSFPAKGLQRLFITYPIGSKSVSNQDPYLASNFCCLMSQPYFCITTPCLLMETITCIRLFTSRPLLCPLLCRECASPLTEVISLTPVPSLCPCQLAMTPLKSQSSGPYHQQLPMSLLSQSISCSVVFIICMWGFLVFVFCLFCSFTLYLALSWACFLSLVNPQHGKSGRA